MKAILALIIVNVMAVVSASSGFAKFSAVEILDSSAEELLAKEGQYLAASRTARLNIGTVLSGDRVLYSATVQQDAIANTIRYQDVTYYSITVIRAVHALEVGTTQLATAGIIDGGVGSNNVTVRFTSARGRAFDFRFMVYGR